MNDTTRDDRMQAMHEAGAELVRTTHVATGERPEYLAREVTLEGDVERLDEVAREHGLPDGMPDGYSRPLADEWRAVFEGARDALEGLEDEAVA